MKIISGKISLMREDELKDLAVKDPSKISQILQRACENKYVGVIEFLAGIPHLSSSNIKTILSYSARDTSLTTETKINILEKILNYPVEAISQFSDIVNSFISNPEIAAFMLLKKGTPTDIIYNIIEKFSLLDTHLSFLVNHSDNLHNQEILTNSKVLTALKIFLEEGHMWENKNSGIMITARLNKNPADEFIVQISTYNLHPLIFLTLQDAAENLSRNNQNAQSQTALSKLKNNLAQNNSSGNQMAKILQSQTSIEDLAKLIEEKPESIHWAWDVIENKIRNREVEIYSLFDKKYKGTNFIQFLIQTSRDIIPRIIDTIKSSPLLSSLSLSANLRNFVHLCLNDKSFSSKILELPIAFFDSVIMTTEDRQIVNQFHNIPSKTHDNNNFLSLKDLLSTTHQHNTNWYNRYSMADTKFTIESGMKENIITTLIIALTFIFKGVDIKAVSKKLNISEEQIEMAMQDPQMVEKAGHMMNNDSDKENSKITPNSFVNAIIQHEGLIPGQTPFRYTNQRMTEWNTIHGFQIDKSSPRPSNRMNFIFLKNPNDVQKAVMKQFENYISFPQRYGWQSEPNIEESLRKFDQTGVDGKMKFLKAKFPSINFSLPLSTIFHKISINDL